LIMKNLFSILFLLLPLGLLAQLSNEKPQVKITNGILEGISSSGISIFKGIPFAAPPVGDLRWKEPQPVKNWLGVRQADQFGPRPMQLPIFGDMNSRSNGLSEDCLYLNLWTPAKSADENLPVLVYFFGGGFKAGDGSEPRYDGESMAHKGIVTVTVNYRVGVFGLFAHPELSKETTYHGSGNYGYMDQWASLRWVQQNIAAFGGDPKRVIIAGESAGSSSVSAQMASPLSRNLIAGAIGESGSVLLRGALTQAESEANGVAFAKGAGAKSLADLRAMSAEKILEEGGKPDSPRFALNLDGYFFPKDPISIYASGEQAHVPLLVGWNSEEANARAILGTSEPTPENYKIAIEKLYGEKAGEVLKLYAGNTINEVKQSATDLAGDRFTGFSTWKWSDVCSKTGNSPVYRYFYSRPRPTMKPEHGNLTAGVAGGVMIANNSNTPKPPAPTGAVHSAEIEYAMGNLPTNRIYDWQPEDYKISQVMQE
jgi:para-nitrobenzyl esterase